MQGGDYFSLRCTSGVTARGYSESARVSGCTECKCSVI
jgi:hypothetical protein